MYKLLIEDDEGGKTAVSLIRDEITIGRKEGNTIRLTDRNVSRRHGRIIREDDRVFIEEVAARYGIKKNGNPIDERAELKAGDVVLIGDYRLTLRADSKATTKGGPSKASPKRSAKPTADDDFDGGQRNATQIVQAVPAKLVVISSNFAGQEFPLGPREMVIGRGDDCHIIIDHRSISQKHAKIVREDTTTYKIVDLNSKNGVKVSGDSYRATHLKRGDVVELGHVKFRFVEPGENYVFQPQIPSPAAPIDLASSHQPLSSGGMDTKKMGLIAGAAFLTVIAVGVAFLLFAGDDPGHRTSGDIEIAQDRQDDQHLQDTAGLEDTINAARASIEEGELQRPIGRLEAILDMMDNIPAQYQSEIEELLRTAQNEIPFKRSYGETRDKLGDGDFVAALDELMSIPPHSLFYQRMRDDGTVNDIFEGVMAQAQQALANEQFDEARRLADEILMVDDDHSPALQLLARADAAAEQRIALARAEQQERSRQPAPSTGGTRATSSSSRPSPTPTPTPTLTPGEAADKHREAGRQFASGNPREAINICGEALRAGHTACHRIMGLSYMRLDDTVNACRHFSQYLATNPSTPGPVQNQMDTLGCE